MEVEEKLQQLGIPQSHIKWLKETKLLPAPANYFPNTDILKQKIPVSKIVGLDLRGEPGYTWWEHLSQERGNLPGLGDLAKRLIELGLEGYKDTYLMEEYAEDINILYYPEFDFYISSNGSHRVAMAKLTNVEYMIGDVTIMKKTN